MGRDRSEGGERRSWHGFGQPKPKLPYYFARSKRLRSLDEFEQPQWKGRVRFGGEGRVTVRGVARETLQWLAIFAIVGFIGASAWRWLYGSQTCVEIFSGFKIGWC
jgi:hypothetical protein